MLRKILLPSIFAVLAYGFWVSPDFKEIAAGVAIFLFGMLALEEGFRAFSGGLLERVLHRSTDKLYKSLTFGVVTTTLMQSSSLVSVITISFLSAGMIGLKAGLGIIFGANLGTTTGAWLVAGFGLKVKISAYALPMLVFGIILIFQKAKALKGIGYVLAGLGFLFLGIHHMKEGFEAFKETIDLAEYAVAGYPGLFLFLLIGVVATVVMQSSHATLVLIITALASGQITYENALALAIGANVGTTITAIIGSMSANVEGKRLAGGHLIFNLATGLVAIAAIHPLMAAVGWISDGVGIAPDDHSLRLAVFHTVFNAIGIVLMSPLINVLERSLVRMMPATEPEHTRPIHLNDAALEFSHTAMEAARLETEHLYEEAFATIAHGIDLHRKELFSDVDLEDVVASRDESIEIDMAEDYENTVKVLYSEIIAFVTKAQAKQSAEVGQQLLKYRIACRHIVEAVKSVQEIRDNLAEYTASENPHIREAYNGIRVMLGNVLRDLAEIREGAQQGEPVSIAELDSLRLEVKQADVLTSGTVDELIRDDLITAKMATSLMNDSSYAFYAVNHLVEMAACLYATEDPEERAAEASVALSIGEVDELAHEEERGPPPTASRPAYINEEALRSTPSILSAARLETDHLYEKSLPILSHGIDLHRREIFSGRDLADVIESRDEPIPIDIDEDYEQTVKVLYAAITRFVSTARTLVPVSKSNRLLAMRLAARHVVEAVKAVKHMRKNLSVYIHSKNLHIRRAYNDIRIMLGTVIRELNVIREAAKDGGEDARAGLEPLRKLVREYDSLQNGSLDMLVREELITPWMATSLMNDSAYAQHTARHLISMAECVLAPEEPEPPSNEPDSAKEESGT
ncbi:MAG: Na/Pi symporter [Deltaproteobacteria bacterium]|jgi:phosphate:Na+ symporter|nr:Na/Pi symporter [Deltaproteobacteria bacterium]MBW2536658.1 Na/Pi symporter [Deltaproteobacteria bacterium]